VYIFAGPSSTRVVEQYVEVIGRPQLPPYWGLGFHLCRYNYNSIQNLKLVVDRNRKLEIPYVSVFLLFVLLFYMSVFLLLVLLIDVSVFLLPVLLFYVSLFLLFVLLPYVSVLTTCSFNLC